MTTPQTTRIEVRRDGAHLRADLRTGHLSPRRLPDEDVRVRVALVATVALLLAGDRVRVEVVVGAGVELEIVETAGTVAYDMRGASARWDVTVVVEDGGLLVWPGLPFVVADGAEVDRSMTIALHGCAEVVLRETYLLGRTGEGGGRLRTSTRASRDARPLLAEDLVLDLVARHDPAVLGGRRCVDAMTTLGLEVPGPGALQLAGLGSVHRRLVDDLHESDLTPMLQVAIEATRRGNTVSLASVPRLEPVART